MDYTKVISTVKKYALAVVDEITTNLESLHTSIKQETDSIKTDVADVRGAIGTASQIADAINGEVI